MTDPIGVSGGVNLFAYVASNPLNSIDPFGLAECYSYKIVSVDTISVKVLSKNGKCPWGWVVQMGLENNKDRFIGEIITKGCETGNCSDKKEVKGKTRTLSDVTTQTFWWKGISATVDENEGVSKGWPKCTMTLKIDGTGIVDGWEGSCCE